MFEDGVNTWADDEFEGETNDIVLAPPPPQVPEAGPAPAPAAPAPAVKRTSPAARQEYTTRSGEQAGGGGSGYNSYNSQRQSSSYGGGGGRARAGNYSNYPNSGQIPEKGPWVAYVGNLSFEARQGDIVQAFEKVGARVGDVRLITRDDGSSKGFAYVELQDADSLKTILSQLHGQMLLGRALKLDIADARGHRGSGRESGASGGGGYRGGNNEYRRARDSGNEYHRAPNEYASFSSSRNRGQYDSPDRRGSRGSTGDPRRDEAQLAGLPVHETTTSASDRPKLQLKPRSSDAATSVQAAAPSSIFGQARPRDEREYLEQRKKREEEELKKKKAEADKEKQSKDESLTSLPAPTDQTPSSPVADLDDTISADNASKKASRANVKDSPARGTKPARKYVALEQVARKQSPQAESQQNAAEEADVPESQDQTHQPSETPEAPEQSEKKETPPTESTTTPSTKRGGRRHSKGDKPSSSNGAKRKPEHTNDSGRIVLDPGAVLADTKPKPHHKGRSRASDPGGRASTEKEGRARGARGKARGGGDRARGSPATKPKPETRPDDTTTNDNQGISKRQQKKQAKAATLEPPKAKTVEPQNAFALLEDDDDD